MTPPLHATTLRTDVIFRKGTLTDPRTIAGTSRCTRLTFLNENGEAKTGDYCTFHDVNGTEWNLQEIHQGEFVSV